MKFDIKTIDTLTPGLKDLDDKTPGMVDQALTDAGMLLWDRVVNMAPKPPLLTGNLRGSGALFVSSKKIMEVPSGVVVKGSPTSSQTTPKGEAWFGLDTPYTAYQHELAMYKSHTVEGINQDSGPKFISVKLGRYKNDFAKLYGITFSNSLDNQGKPTSGRK